MDFWSVGDGSPILARNTHPRLFIPSSLVSNLQYLPTKQDPYSSEPGDDDGAAYSDFPNDLAYVT